MKRQMSHWLLAALPGLALAGLLLWLATTVCAAPTPPSAPLCVNTTGSGCDIVCGSGCYASVQAAVNAAYPGAEIRIAAGTYTDPGGTVAVITKELTLRGGYDPSCAGFDPDLYHTVLDAQGGGSVVSITNAGDVLLESLTLTHGDGSGNCFGGLYGCGGGIYAENTNLHVGGCVITHNVANSSGAGHGMGGGIYTASSAGVDIWESRIVSNTANTASSAGSYSMGGGVYIAGGVALLIQNQILDNVGSSAGVGAFGGGLYLNSLTYARLLTNTIRGNRAATGSQTGDGGGLYFRSSTGSIVGNRIENNWTSPNYAGSGGGVYVAESDVHLTRNLIIGNITGVGWVGNGGGVYIASRKPVTVSNNLIANNAARTSGGGGVLVWERNPPAAQALLINNTIVDNGDSGVVAAEYAVLTMTNNIVADHTTGLTVAPIFTGTITANHNLFWDTNDPITGSNAILEDPLLSADYRLYPGSPALDAGLAIPWLTTDLEGTPRPQGSGYDLGAYEGTVLWKVYLPLVVRNH